MIDLDNCPPPEKEREKQRVKALEARRARREINIGQLVGELRRITSEDSPVPSASQRVKTSTKMDIGTIAANLLSREKTRIFKGGEVSAFLHFFVSNPAAQVSPNDIEKFSVVRLSEAWLRHMGYPAVVEIPQRNSGTETKVAALPARVRGGKSAGFFPRSQPIEQPSYPLKPILIAKTNTGESKPKAVISLHPVLADVLAAKSGVGGFDLFVHDANYYPAAKSMAKGIVRLTKMPVKIKVKSEESRRYTRKT